jgi:hypothetical protein
LLKRRSDEHPFAHSVVVIDKTVLVVADDQLEVVWGARTRELMWEPQLTSPLGCWGEGTDVGGRGRLRLTLSSASLMKPMSLSASCPRSLGVQPRGRTTTRPMRVDGDGDVEMESGDDEDQDTDVEEGEGGRGAEERTNRNSCTLPPSRSRHPRSPRRASQACCDTVQSDSHRTSGPLPPTHTQ